MTNVIKYVAYSVGSATLLGGSFFLVAALSGTPMSEIAGIGSMFPANQDASRGEATDLPPLVDELERDQRTPNQVFESARSPLHAFVLPTPFSASELEDLENRLQNRMRELDLRERDLDEREQALTEDSQHYEELFAELEDLRTSILEMDDARVAEAEELLRDQEAFQQEEIQAFRDLAKIYEEGKATDMARMLSDVWSAEKAAMILAALSDERAGVLLGEIYKLDKQKGAAYQDAYRKVERTQ